MKNILMNCAILGGMLIVGCTVVSYYLHNCAMGTHYALQCIREQIVANKSPFSSSQLFITTTGG